jgi:hypothetical protein
MVLQTHRQHNNGESNHEEFNYRSFVSKCHAACHGGYRHSSSQQERARAGDGPNRTSHLAGSHSNCCRDGTGGNRDGQGYGLFLSAQTAGAATSPTRGRYTKGIWSLEKGPSSFRQLENQLLVCPMTPVRIISMPPQDSQRVFPAPGGNRGSKCTLPPAAGY